MVAGRFLDLLEKVLKVVKFGQANSFGPSVHRDDVVIGLSCYPGNRGTGERGHLNGINIAQHR